MKQECLNPVYSTTRRVWSQALRAESADTSLSKNAVDARKGGLRTQGYEKHSPAAEDVPPTDPSLPLISIVTVTFNAAAHLEQTIKSVIGQSYDNVEYIIVDGGSTDGTLDIIRRYQHAIDYWVSEKDGGIYDAMNKGIALASGYYIAMLNAADWYAPDLLVTVAGGHSRSSADDGAILFTNYQLFFDELGVAEKRLCSVEPWKGMSMSHQAMFVGAAVYSRVGLYDVSYRLSADYDFYLRAHGLGVTFVHVDDYGVYFRAGGRSAQDKFQNLKEASRALRSAYGVLSIHRLRYLALESFGLLYYRYLQGFLAKVIGPKYVIALRKMRRRISARSKVS